MSEHVKRTLSYAALTYFGMLVVCLLFGLPWPWEWEGDGKAVGIFVTLSLPVLISLAEALE